MIAVRPSRTSYSPYKEAAARLGWSIVAVFRDEGISGAKGR